MLLCLLIANLFKKKQTKILNSSVDKIVVLTKLRYAVQFSPNRILFITDASINSN